MIDAEEFFSTNLIANRLHIHRALEEAKRIRTRQWGYELGIDVLRDKLRLNPKDLFLIAGRAGSGKTALAMQFVNAVLAQMRQRGDAGRIAFFTMEMSASQIIQREAAAVVRVPLHKFHNGDATDAEYDRWEAAIGALVKDRLYISEKAAPTVESLAEQINVLAEEGPVALVVTDMFDLIEKQGEKGTDKALKVGYGLKHIARHFNTPVLSTIQMNREIERRENKTPTKADVMYGGEQPADRILALVPHPEQRNRVDAYTVKNRHGYEGHNILEFDSLSMSYRGAIEKRFDLNEVNPQEDSSHE